MCSGLLEDYMIINPSKGFYQGLRKRSGKQRIVDFLRNHTDYKYKCREIATHTNLGVNTVRNYCHKLVKYGLILNPQKGFYCGIEKNNTPKTINKVPNRNPKNNKTSERTLRRVRKYKEKMNKAFSEYKTKYGCAFCGYNRCGEAIDFHHLYDKKISIIPARFYPMCESTQKEIRKCILLCANCHREENKRLREMTRKGRKRLKWRLRNNPEEIRKFVEERRIQYKKHI